MAYDIYIFGKLKQITRKTRKAEKQQQRQKLRKRVQRREPQGKSLQPHPLPSSFNDI